MVSNKLTTNKYWDACYEQSDLTMPIIINTDREMSFVEIDAYFKNNIPKNKHFKFIEIGCAPGGWMHYFHKNFGYNVEGIEYTSSGARLTENNLNMLDIEAAVYNEDLFDNKLVKDSYDVVFSAGFIEHFDNPALVIEKHVELLKKGGYLILKVPNFRGFNEFFQKITNNNLLNIHNLDIMNLKYFEDISSKHNLEIVDISYIGKINFGLFLGKRPLIYAGYIIQFLVNKLYFLFGKRIFIKDGYLFSPYIIGIYIKR